MSKEIEKMTAIYEKHKNTMYAVALKILKNPQDAEDAVHNTIPQIMRNLDAIKDVDSKDCIYYVTMAVKHMSFNMIRDRHIQTVSLSDIEYEFASDENIAESVIIDESCKIIYQNIKSMPAEYRDVLILHLYYELSTSQISDFLNRKHGTVTAYVAGRIASIVINVSRFIAVIGAAAAGMPMHCPVPLPIRAEVMLMTEGRLYNVAAYRTGLCCFFRRLCAGIMRGIVLLVAAS